MANKQVANKDVGKDVVLKGASIKGEVVFRDIEDIKQISEDVWKTYRSHIDDREPKIVLESTPAGVAEPYPYVVKDTGDRTKFETGSHKDLGKGRGKYHLIPLNTLASVFYHGFAEDSHERADFNRTVAFFIGNIHHALTEKELKDKLWRLKEAYRIFSEDILMVGLPETVAGLAKLYEAGADKYEARDWEKGRPMEVFIDSILRHFFQYLNNETDEDHASAVLWNILSLIDTLRRLPHMAYTYTEIIE